MDLKQLVGALIITMSVASAILAVTFLSWRRAVASTHKFRETLGKTIKPVILPPQNDKDRDYLRMMYEEQAEHARLHEELRGTATGFFMALIAGLVAWAASEGSGNSQRIPPGLLVIAASFVGWIVNVKHYERFQMHLCRLRGFREALEAEVTRDLAKINDACTAYHNKQNPIASWLSLHMLWNVVYIVTLLIGVSLLLPKIAVPQKARSGQTSAQGATPPPVSAPPP